MKGSLMVVWLDCWKAAMTVVLKVVTWVIVKVVLRAGLMADMKA